MLDRLAKFGKDDAFRVELTHEKMVANEAQIHGFRIANAALSQLGYWPAFM